MKNFKLRLVANLEQTLTLLVQHQYHVSKTDLYLSLEIRWIDETYLKV